jgi:hypothetical protein
MPVTPEQLLGYQVKRSRLCSTADADFVVPGDRQQFRFVCILRKPDYPQQADPHPNELYTGKYNYAVVIVFRVDSLPEALEPFVRNGQLKKFETGSSWLEHFGLDVTHWSQFAGKRAFVFFDGYDPSHDISRERLRTLFDTEVQVLLESPASRVDCISKAPVKQTVQQALHLLRSHKGRCIIYVGAGLSAPHIMYGKAVEKLVLQERNCAVDTYVLSLLDAGKRLEVCHSLNRATYAPLTEIDKSTHGHSCVLALSECLSAPVVTTNSDYFFECQGKAAVPLDSKEVPNLALTGYSLVFCIGVGEDRRGFLAHFRRQRGTKHAMLLALSLDETPLPYLTAKDFLLHGDAQVLLPELLKRFDLAPRL